MSSLYIAIPTRNRLRIAGECLPTIYSTVDTNRGDELVVYDDGSEEPIRRLIERCGYIVTTQGIGIDAQRRRHFMDFWERRDEFTHLYLTDSDCFHDPNWRTALLALQEEHGGAPICGYRTATHENYGNNVYRDDPAENVIWQRFAPGTSYLLTRAHVEKVVAKMPERWSWDWAVPGILGYKMAVSRISYLDHIDHGGLHSPESGLGLERAVNPTLRLVAKRQEILSNLGLRDA